MVNVLLSFHGPPKVTLRLAHLESLLKKYVKPDNYPLLFATTDFMIKFNGQAFPFKKGLKTNPVQRVPEHIATYANTALQNLYSPVPKRLAIDLEMKASGTQSFDTFTHSTTASVPATAVTPNHHQPSLNSNQVHQFTTTTASTPSTLTLDSIKADIQKQDTRIASLEAIPNHIKINTSDISPGYRN
jgi:hypothetical protein